MSMVESTTNRGFCHVTFVDFYNKACSITKSSLATEDCIWLGLDNPEPKIMASKVIPGGTGWVDYPIHPDVLISTHMHLSRSQAAALLPYLQTFVETGDL